MFGIEITANAENDLDQIVDYLAIRLANPPAAGALLDDIESVTDAIENDPEMFPLCKDDRLAELGYHKAIVRAYIMIYEIDASESLVRILRFFHSSEDYANKL